MSVVTIGFPRHAEHFKVSAPQKRFLTDRNKLRLLNCGRFGGKTFVACHDLVGKSLRLFGEHCRDPFNSWRSVVRPGPIVTVGVFAPQEGNQKACWDYLTDLVPEVPGKTDGWDNKTVLRDGHIYLFGPRGIEYTFISLWNEGGARSGGFDLGFVDEAGLLKRPTTFTQVVKPLVIRAGFYGDLTMASTPYNNFWDRWCASARAGEGAFRNWSYHHWTCFENPGNTADKIAEIVAGRDEDPYGWRREYLAELFVETPAEDTIAGDAVWSAELLEDCYVHEAGKYTGPFVCGLDLAWGGKDEAVLAVIDKPTCTLVHLEVYPKTSDADLLDIIARADGHWGNADIWFDRTGARARAFADFIPKRYRVHPLVFRRSIDRTRANSDVVSKDLLVRGLTQRMTLGKLKLPHPDDFPFERLPYSNQQDQAKNMAKLRRQMLGLKRVTIRKADGNEEYLYRAELVQEDAHKYGAHDDCIDGVLLAVRGLPAVSVPVTSLDELERDLSW